ncbi:MAG: hypothetical protein IMW97_03460 [Firmicutes bacterium]|nr:hypothetical protein [Candidatus Fermentithermobacillaceae bacterium]
MVNERIESHLDEEILSRMFDGHVSPEEFVEALRHLGRCERCRQETREFWGVVSVLSEIGPSPTGEARDLSDPGPLEEVVLAKLCDVISIHWTFCIPGVRRSRAKLRSLKLNIEFNTRRAVAVKLGELAGAIFRSVLLASPPDLKSGRKRITALMQLSPCGGWFHRLPLAFGRPVRAAGLLGKVALTARSGVQLLAGTLASFVYGGRR